MKASVREWEEYLSQEHGPWSLGSWALAGVAFFNAYALTGLALILLGAFSHPEAQKQLKSWDLVGVRLKRLQLAMFVTAFIAFAFLDPAITEESTEADFASLSVDEAAVDTEANMEAAGDAFAEVEAGSPAYADVVEVEGAYPYVGIERVSNCSAIDGDTLNCGGERIRLLGIDAPELAGHCTVGRACVSGDPIASMRSIQQLIEPTMEIVRYGRDDYGRTLAMVYVSGDSLSCRQLRSGNARYIAEWDNEGALAADCPVRPG